MNISAPKGLLPEYAVTTFGPAIGRDCMPTMQARQTVPLQDAAYSLVMYLGYLFYPPLYIAGPILTFNSFASQQRQPIPVHLKQVSA